MRRERYITEIGLRRRRFRLFSSVLVIFTAAIVLTVIGLLLIMRNPLLAVQSVDIQGLTYIPTSRVQSLLLARVMDESGWKHLLGLKNILIWPDAMTAEDLKLLPEASAIAIRKDYWHRKITVQVMERGHSGTWCFKGGKLTSCYWFDERGLITRTPASEGSLILTVNDYTRAGISQGETVIAPELLPNLFSIFEAVKNMGVNFKEIRLEDLSLQEVKVPTYDGPNLLFSLRFSAVNTPAALLALKAKTKISKLQEIDFRVENRIYYK